MLVIQKLLNLRNGGFAHGQNSYHLPIPSITDKR
jgi:hypothetical protein